MNHKITVCPRDGFPILTVQGKRQCLVEFLRHCLVGRKITDVVDRGGTLYYLFNDGHELPSLCFCCGEPLGSTDLVAQRKHERGRKIVDVFCDTAQVKGRTVIYFELDFSRKFLERETYCTRLSALSAERLIHPAACDCHPSAIQ